MESDDVKDTEINTYLRALRDQLKDTALLYNKLCSSLRDVEFLASSVNLDYYDAQNTGDVILNRLEEWRSLERKIDQKLGYHRDNSFENSSDYRKNFIGLLKISHELRHKKLKADKLTIFSSRLKEGIFATKYAHEARKRVLNIADFITKVKEKTNVDGDDYWDNMLILHALISWSKEVVYDSARVTSSSKDKYKNESIVGQTIYANEIIRQVLDFCINNTTTSEDAKNDELQIQKNVVFDRMLDEPNLHIVDDEIKELYKNKKYNTSQITYYLFSLFDDIKNGNLDGYQLIEYVFEKLDISKIGDVPYHIYDIHEYFCNIDESRLILQNIHILQQLALKNVLLVKANSIFKVVEKIINNPEFQSLIDGFDKDDNNHSLLLLRGILSAIQGVKFMMNPDEKKLLTIWDKDPKFDKEPVEQPSEGEKREIYV